MSDETQDAVLAERARCIAIFQRWGTARCYPGKPYLTLAEAHAAIEQGTTLEQLEEQLEKKEARG